MSRGEKEVKISLDKIIPITFDTNLPDTVVPETDQKTNVLQKRLSRALNHWAYDPKRTDDNKDAWLPN